MPGIIHLTLKNNAIFTRILWRHSKQCNIHPDIMTVMGWALIAIEYPLMINIHPSAACVRCESMSSCTAFSFDIMQWNLPHQYCFIVVDVLLHIWLDNCMLNIRPLLLDKTIAWSEGFCNQYTLKTGSTLQRVSFYPERLHIYIPTKCFSKP